MDLPKVAVHLPQDGKIDIQYDFANPPGVFFDTNVLRGLNPEGIRALQRIKAERGFRYHFSILNFTELASHLGDPPSEKVPNPFKKFQPTFRKISELFVDEALPSAEQVLLEGLGLTKFLDPVWVVDPVNIWYQISQISNSDNLEEIQALGISPAHYKKLKETDGKSFREMIRGAKEEIQKPLKFSKNTLKWLLHVYSFLIYRASGKRKRLSELNLEAQRKVFKFFNEEGGKMFESHLIRLLKRIIDDGRLAYGNDFYDMLQLLLLQNPNLFFVTDDRPFFSYYMGAETHRVVPWKGFKNS